MCSYKLGICEITKSAEQIILYSWSDSISYDRKQLGNIGFR